MLIRERKLFIHLRFQPLAASLSSLLWSHVDNSCFLAIISSYLFLTAGLPLNAFPSRCYILTSGRTQHLWSFLSSLFLLAPTTKRQWMREREEREAFPCMWSLLGFLCPDLAITWWFHRLTACSLLSLTSCLPLTVNHLMDSTLERKRNHRNPSVS